eukprot:1023253-Rhodomonas_salina.1
MISSNVGVLPELVIFFSASSSCSTYSSVDLQLSIASLKRPHFSSASNVRRIRDRPVVGANRVRS